MATDHEWDQLLTEIQSFIIAAANQEGRATQVMAEEIICKTENYLHVFYAIIDTVQAYQEMQHDSEMEEMIGTLFDLVQELHHILSRWRDIELGIDPSYPYKGLKAEKDYDGRRGRPKYIIKVEQLLFLRDLRFSWTQIASLYGISHRTLYNIRSKSEVTALTFNRFSHISDADLQEVITDIKTTMPEAGQAMIKGVLQGRGIYVSMARIQECISVVDPVNTALRWAAPRRRRVYSVPYPNAIWHIDGNHKLIRYTITM